MPSRSDPPDAEPTPDGPLHALSTEALKAELSRREHGLRKLRARHARLLMQLRQVEAEIEALGGGRLETEAAPGRRGRASSPAANAARRPRAPRAANSVSLAEAIALAVEVRAVVTPAEVARLVKANGYVSHAKNFGMMVANALAKDERFRRLERGRYERLR